MKYWNTYLTLGITASSRQRRRLNNKTANPELRNLCSWVEVWQDVAYSNPSSPTGNGGHVIKTSPTMLYYLMVLTSFNLILGYGIWGDYEDSTAEWAWRSLNMLFDSMISATVQAIPVPETGCVLILHRKCILKNAHFLLYCNST